MKFITINITVEIEADDDFDEKEVWTDVEKCVESEMSGVYCEMWEVLSDCEVGNAMTTPIQTSTFTLSDEQRESFKRRRHDTNKSHPLMIERREKFGDMLENKFTERADNVK